MSNQNSPVRVGSIEVFTALIVKGSEMNAFDYYHFQF